MNLDKMNETDQIFLHANDDWTDIKHLFEGTPTADLSENVSYIARFCCMGFDTEEARSMSRSLWEQHFPQFNHITLNLYEAQTRSIVDACSSHLPADALMGTATNYMVHIHQWDDIYFLDLLESPLALTHQLIDDLPALTSAFPFHIILWVDLYTLEVVNQLSSLIFYAQFIHRERTEGELTLRSSRYDRLLEEKEKLSSSEDDLDRGTTSLSIAHMLKEAYLISDAGAYYKQALAYGKTAQNVPLLAASYEGIGDILMKETDVYNAIKCYYLALDGYKLAGTQHELAQIYQKLGDAHWQLYKRSQALLLYQHALDAYGASKQPLKKALLHQKLAQYHKENDNAMLWDDHTQHSITSFQQASAHRELADIYFEKAKREYLTYDYLNAHQQALLSLGYAKKSKVEALVSEIEAFITELEVKIEEKEANKKKVSTVQKTPKIPQKEEKMGRRGFLARFLPKIDSDNK